MTYECYVLYHMNEFILLAKDTADKVVLLFGMCYYKFYVCEYE